MTPDVPTLHVVEDGGLATLVRRFGGGGISAALLHDPEVRAATIDVLTQSIPADLLDPVAPAAQRNPAILAALRQAIGAQLEAGRGPLRSIPTDEATLLALFRDTLGWGPAQAYLDDARIQEVKINGTQIAVQEEGADFVPVPEQFADPQQVLARAQLVASRHNVALDQSHPQGTLPLAHGTRMHVTVPPCTPAGTALVCIRRGRRSAWTLVDGLQRAMFSQEIVDLLLLFARARCSFLIAGETGSGKTALLESIVNSWPGEPHVLTIEDNTLEIQVRHPLWTRELVQTDSEPAAFGRAAREALRQTPGVIAPGETRAEEAGAILTLAVSGHAVITTLHAKSCQAAVQRFADCAAMPGAYGYAGRRTNALEDTCATFEVVIHIEKLDGRRFISAICLLDGVTHDRQGAPRPRLVPLAELLVDDAGRPTWATHAAAAGDALCWAGDTDATPQGLAQKLRRLRLDGRLRAAPTSRAALDTAIARADQLVAAGQVEPALATLRRAWEERPERRVLAAAARALEAEPARMAAAAAASAAQADRVATLLDRRAWATARQQVAIIQRDLALMAAIAPAGRWEEIRQQAEAGAAVDTLVEARTAHARLALERGAHPQEALALLGDDMSDRASPEVALAALSVRREAVGQLVAAGEIRDEVRAALAAQIDALRTLREVPHA